MNYLPSLQLIQWDRILHPALSCPWGPLDHPLLWVLELQTHPGHKDKGYHRHFFHFALLLESISSSLSFRDVDSPCHP